MDSPGAATYSFTDPKVVTTAVPQNTYAGKGVQAFREWARIRPVVPSSCGPFPECGGYP